MNDSRTRIPLVAKIAAWIMLIATVVAIVPEVFSIATAEQGDTLPMMWSVETRVDGFGSKLPYLIYFLLCGTVGILVAAFILRGSLIAYGISLAFATWASWDVINSIHLNGWPDPSGIVTVVITLLLLSGLPGYCKLVSMRLGNLPGA